MLQNGFFLSNKNTDLNPLFEIYESFLNFEVVFSLKHVSTKDPSFLFLDMTYGVGYKKIDLKFIYKQFIDILSFLDSHSSNKKIFFLLSSPNLFEDPALNAFQDQICDFVEFLALTHKAYIYYIPKIFYRKRIVNSFHPVDLLLLDMRKNQKIFFTPNSCFQVIYEKDLINFLLNFEFNDESYVYQLPSEKIVLKDLVDLAACYNPNVTYSFANINQINEGEESFLAYPLKLDFDIENMLMERISYQENNR